MLSLQMQLLHQRAQDEQGFIVMASWKDYKIGSVVDKAHCLNLATRKHETSPPVQVIGLATVAEWIAQQKRYGYTPQQDYPFFYKVRAE